MDFFIAVTRQCLTTKSNNTESKTFLDLPEATLSIDADGRVLTPKVSASIEGAFIDIYFTCLSLA